MHIGGSGKVVETVSIRTWTEYDLEYVSSSISRERWGHTRRDVERAWRWEPDGCFIAESESEPVGHVSTVCYGKLAWLGLLIVNPEKRGRGVGTALMRRAIRYLKRAGAESIRLEAEETAVPLYRSLGFSEEFDSLRFAGQANLAQKESSGEEVARMNDEDIEKLVDFDSKYFGSPRTRVLRELLRADQGYCFIAKHGREPVGYIMCREITNSFWIGPWICGEQSLSERLLEACVGQIKDEKSEVRFGFPAPNESMQALARKKGFEFKGKSIRMVCGASGHQGVPKGVYGIAGPEKG